MEKLAYSEKKIEKNPWLIEDDKPAVPKVKREYFSQPGAAE